MDLNLRSSPLSAFHLRMVWGPSKSMMIKFCKSHPCSSSGKASFSCPAAVGQGQTSFQIFVDMCHVWLRQFVKVDSMWRGIAWWSTSTIRSPSTLPNVCCLRVSGWALFHVEWICRWKCYTDHLFIRIKGKPEWIQRLLTFNLSILFLHYIII